MEEEVVRESELWERFVAVGGLLLVAAITFLVAKGIARILRGKTRWGLHGLERLAAPIALLVTIAASRLIAERAPVPPIVALEIELLLVLGTFWLGARLLDVVWSTGRKSARLRNQPSANLALLATRQLGKTGLALAAIVVVSIRLGVSEQLYIALGAIGAALTFAARAPISNAVTFVEMLFSPPFHIGDRVRVGDFRGGDVAQGEVIAMSFSTVTIRSKRRTLIEVPNALFSQMRTENLSQADRRRPELRFPIAEPLPAEKVRAACATIEDELRDHELVSDYREPHVWVSGYQEGLFLKASVWLKRGQDRRRAQAEILLEIRSRFEELTGTSPS